MSFSLVSNIAIRKKLSSELENGHFLVAIIGGILQLPWTFIDSLFTSEHWLSILYMRIFTCILPIVLYYIHKKINLSSSWCLLLVILSISIESFYALSHLNVDDFKVYTFTISTLFIGVGMLVTWELKYSIIYIVSSTLVSMLMFYLFSELSVIELLKNGGFGFYTIAIFSVILISMRYKNRFNDLKIQTELANSIDELNEKTHENKVLYEELQLIDKSAIVAEMTSSVAHELNTPLSVLKNSSSILLESFQEVLKLPNKGVNWTNVNYILLKLSDRPMFTSYFQKVKETERIENYLKTIDIHLPEASIHLLASSGICRDDQELLSLILKNKECKTLIELIYQLRIIHVMNENISSSVNQTAKIVQEMRAIQLQTPETELTYTNLNLSFEKATSIFEFQTGTNMSIKTNIDKLIEIKTSKFKLIQLWVKLFDFIALANDMSSTENTLYVTAATDSSHITVTFQHAEVQGFNYEVLSNVNSIFRQSNINKIDLFNLNILRTFIADFNFEIKISDTSLLIVMPLL
jgi:signal transduction histidine kinase